MDKKYVLGVDFGFGRKCEITNDGTKPLYIFSDKMIKDLNLQRDNHIQTLKIGNIEVKTKYKLRGEKTESYIMSYLASPSSINLNRVYIIRGISGTHGMFGLAQTRREEFGKTIIKDSYNKLIKILENFAPEEIIEDKIVKPKKENMNTVKSQDEFKIVEDIKNNKFKVYIKSKLFNFIPYFKKVGETDKIEKVSDIVKNYYGI